MSISNLPEGAELLPPPTFAERLEINEVIKAVRSYTHPVFFKNRSHIGTIVVFRCGEHLFGFTAAHNIKNDTEIIFCVGKAGEQVEFTIRETHIHPKYDSSANVSNFDLAILELEPTAPINAGNVAQLATSIKCERNPIQYDFKYEACAWIVGFPAELARPSNGAEIYQTAFCAQIKDYSPEQLSLFYYDEAYKISPQTSQYERGKTTESPKGYSGGGIWMIKNSKEELFNPLLHIKLIGILTHWCPQQKELKCVPSNVIVDFFNEVLTKSILK